MIMDVGNIFVGTAICVRIHVFNIIAPLNQNHVPVQTKLRFEVKMILNTAAAGANAALIVISTHAEKRKRRWSQRPFFKKSYKL